MQCTTDEKWSLVWFFNGYWTALRGASAWTPPDTGWRFSRAQRLPTRSSSFTFSRDSSSGATVAQGRPLESELKHTCAVYGSELWRKYHSLTTYCPQVSDFKQRLWTKFIRWHCTKSKNMRDISVLYLTIFTILGCTFWGKKPLSNKKKLLWQLGTQWP